MKVALDFLARSGGLDSPQEAFEFIGRHVAEQISQGQESTLALSNFAISAYQRHRRSLTLHLID